MANRIGPLELRPTAGMRTTGTPKLYSWQTVFKFLHNFGVRASLRSPQTCMAQNIVGWFCFSGANPAD
jgi:hypothetical protein